MAQKSALIIGNSHYQDPSLARLAAPTKDVLGLAETLGAAPIGGFEVTTLFDALAADLHKAIAKFFANRKRDDLLLYFSGHGVLDEQGQLYFAAQDIERDLLSGTAVPAAFVKMEMDRCSSRWNAYNDSGKLIVRRDRLEFHGSQTGVIWGMPACSVATKL